MLLCRATATTDVGTGVKKKVREVISQSYKNVRDVHEARCAHVLLPLAGLLNLDDFSAI